MRAKGAERSTGFLGAKERGQHPVAFKHGTVQARVGLFYVLQKFDQLRLWNNLGEDRRRKLKEVLELDLKGGRKEQKLCEGDVLGRSFNVVPVSGAHADRGRKGADGAFSAKLTDAMAEELQQFGKI